MESRRAADALAQLRLPWVALVLLIAAWVVYSPGVNRPFSTDQVSYFAELGGATSLAAGLAQYDYAVSRRYWKGDDALFRPLLFVWLAVANSLFTYHHVWWNVAGIVLHVLVGLALYQCLVVIQPSVFALPAAVLFVVSKPAVELVLWSHLGGYLLAWACLLIALGAFVRVVRGHGVVPVRLVVTYIVAVTAASFLHEVAIAFALIGALLLISIDRKRGWLWFSPIVIFAALYGVHILRAARVLYVDRKPEGLLSLRNLALAVPKSIEVFGRWTMEVAVPAVMQLRVSPFEPFRHTFAFSVANPLHVLNAALVLAAFVMLVRRPARLSLTSASPLLILVLGTMVGYVALLSLGRPLADLHSAPYYLYFFSLFMLVLVYSGIDLNRIRGDARGLAAVVAALIVLQAADTRATSVAVGRDSRNASSYLGQVAGFVDAHRTDPHFTFNIAKPPSDLDPAVELLEGYPDDAHATITSPRMTEVLFRRYYNARTPAYVLDGQELAGPPQHAAGGSTVR